MFRGKTKDASKDKLTLFLSQEAAHQLLAAAQASAGNPDGVCVSIFISPSKFKPGEEFAAFAVEASQPSNRQAAATGAIRPAFPGAPGPSAGGAPKFTFKKAVQKS